MNSLFEGPAGSGKTTRLFQSLAALVSPSSFLPEQKILALTRMHGSRRRMHGRLSEMPRLHGRFACMTIDSFAWRTLRRWRTLARTRGWSDVTENDYQAVCRQAGGLLSETLVQRWITRSFPIVVVDELQDSQDGQLEIVSSLARSATCFLAADHFQDLDALQENAAVAWARANCSIVPLIKIHRTRASGLLTGAEALRNGRALPSKGSGFTVLGAKNVNVAASFVSKNLSWWSSTNDIAIISPVGPHTSPFVRDVMLRVERGPIGNPPVGPHRVGWENSQEEEYRTYVQAVGLTNDLRAQLCPSDLNLAGSDVVSAGLRLWFEHQRTVAGRTSFAAEEIQRQTRLIHQRARAFRAVRDGGFRALTIHQAKNREFASVIVLWPYEVTGTSERKRRLLYNAITRAKLQALVIVQNPARLDSPPFRPETPTAT